MPKQLESARQMLRMRRTRINGTKRRLTCRQRAPSWRASRKKVADGEQDNGEKGHEQERLQDESSEEADPSRTRRVISQAPLNLLFNPSLLIKKDVWDIDIASLLEMFLRLLNVTGNKDLRIC